MIIESFRATILFGVLSILATAVFGVVTMHVFFVLAAVILAGASYVTQATFTTAGMLIDRSNNAVDPVLAISLRQQAERWQAAATMMWLATLTMGAVNALAAVLIWAKVL